MIPRKTSTAFAAALLFTLFSQSTHADITYSLEFDPTSSPEARQVADSVATAAALYNQHGSFNKQWYVYYNPGIPTAEANYDGYMGYGSQRTVRVALHEGGHTLGMGTGPNYGNLIAGGVWGGDFGNQAQFDTYNEFGDGLHGDGHALWPGGMNFENEDGFIERIWHIRIMAAMRADMGIMAFTKEAQNELVHPGETATFRVHSPEGATYQWYRNGTQLDNGDDISGATTPTLRIANSEPADAGNYYCASTGAGETLNSRTRQLWVEPKALLGHWEFDGNARDSANSHHAITSGSPSYVAGKVGQAIDLDGSNDSLDLPETATLAKNFTIATWVQWDGGNDWQRIFDFGTGTHQYLFLTPKAGGGGLRLAFKDSINGVNTEYTINAPALPTGQWVHLAAVLQDGRAILYRDGKPIGSTAGIPNRLIDFQPTNNFIGRSQFPDPLFDGRIDDFKIYNHALSGAEIWDLWGQSANDAPEFTSPAITLPKATSGEPYSSQSLAPHAGDSDGDALTFTKLSGPSWLAIAADGTLSGTPNATNTGRNTFVFRVEDPAGASSDATVHLGVTGTVAYWNFEEGTADTYVPYAPGSAGQFDGTMLDTSGNDNHLSAWSNDWHWYRSEINGTETPQLEAPNQISIENAGSFPAISAIGTSLTDWSPSEWTIEAAIRPDDATNGFQTFIGRDSQGAYAEDPALAALYFSITPEGAIRFIFTDVVGNNWRLDTANNAVQDENWYAVAASSDGSTLSLYLKNLSNEETSYSLMETLDISQSANPAMSPGTGDGNDWDSGVFSIARGLYNGGHTDRFFGHLDNIRFSEGALAPQNFLYSSPISAPATPSPLAATTSSSTQIELNWPPQAATTRYSLKRSLSSGGPFMEVSNSSATSYSDQSLQPGTTYYYVVTALNETAESEPSPEISATTWTPAQNWRFENFDTIEITNESADGEDPDNDQMSNLLERAFGGDPNLAEPNLQPVLDKDEPRLSIIYRKDTAAADLDFTVQESRNLNTFWEPATGTERILREEGSIQHIRFTRAAGTDTKLFLRLQVSESE